MIIQVYTWIFLNRISVFIFSHKYIFNTDDLVLDSQLVRLPWRRPFISLSAFLSYLCVSLCRIKTSWSFSIHVLPSVSAVLAQLMFEQSHWWDLMVIASDTTRRSNLTCCECCDLGWIWNVVFSLDKFCFLDCSPLWVLVKLFYFLWRTFFP